jgi:hypothetical protein
MRPENWPALLEAHVAKSVAQGFKWGELDCVQFVSSWRGLMTGDDPAAVFKGKYASEIGASRIMLGLGYRGAVEFAFRLFGQPMPFATFAQRGDIVATEEALGLCMGANGAFLTETGLELLPARFFKFAWKV